MATENERSAPLIVADCRRLYPQMLFRAAKHVYVLDNVQIEQFPGEMLYRNRTLYRHFKENRTIAAVDRPAFRIPIHPRTIGSYDDYWIGEEGIKKALSTSELDQELEAITETANKLLKG